MKQKTTRRGVYKNLEDSDIMTVHNGKTYKFTSYKKMEIFFKRVCERQERIKYELAKLERLTGCISNYETIAKTYDSLFNQVYDVVYDNMLYH